MTTVPQVKRMLAISSAKGGVGKSTVTVQLALALQAKGQKVGIFDADIYGPNIPQLLGAPDVGQTQSADQPILRSGIKTVSIADHISAETPMVWRGPMVSKAIMQLMYGAKWGDLDILLVDMPPGTGDIQLTMAQKISLSGAIIVTTPESMALADARRGAEMFRKVNIPVLGVIENMAIYQCSNCGHEQALFGHAGVQVLSDAIDVPVLGQLPFHQHFQLDSETEACKLAGGDAELSRTVLSIASCLVEGLDKAKA